jgi:hypothetical protein
MDVNNKMENVSNCTQTEDTPTTKTFVWSIMMSWMQKMFRKDYCNEWKNGYTTIKENAW